MKNEDFIQMETYLANTHEYLKMAHETCDTSKHENWFETDTEINDWNKRFNEVINEIQKLRDEMIFTFRIEDSEE